MGYNSEFVAVRGPIIVDIETAPLDNAADFLEPLQPAKNLKDPIKIAADIAERTAARDALLGLDYNVSRIVAIGVWTEDGGAVEEVCTTEDEEAQALAAFWIMEKGRRLVGFRIREFDLPMMIQRSRYLGIKAPSIDLGKYSRGNRVHDLFDLLTFQDSQRQFAMRRTLHAFCRRFGIPVEDAIAGKDIAALVAAGDWDAVKAHVRSDVALTRQLAVRLGVVPAPAMVAL